MSASSSFEVVLANRVKVIGGSWALRVDLKRDENVGFKSSR